MDTAKLLSQVERCVTPVLESLGFELIEREFVTCSQGRVLRLYIDREGVGVHVSDCETASRAVEAVLDVENFIPGHYVLEVSSPGLERPLRRPKDFERFVGEKIDVRTRESIGGRTHFIGILKGIEGEVIFLQEGGEEWSIPLEILKKAYIKYDFSKGSQRR